jgi:hypothetical protein
VPKSRIRRRSAYTPQQTKNPAKLGNPQWLVPVMVGCFVIGLLWIVVYYVSRTEYPIPGVSHWNMAVGFGFIVAGFVLATRWK